MAIRQRVMPLLAMFLLLGFPVGCKKEPEKDPPKPTDTVYKIDQIKKDTHAKVGETVKFDDSYITQEYVAKIVKNAKPAPDDKPDPKLGFLDCGNNPFVLNGVV